jgi:hypothetical protein
MIFQTITFKVEADKINSLKEFAKGVNAKEVNSEKASTSLQALQIKKGQFKAGEKPSDFGSVWENDERTIETIRAKAWPKRN